MTSGKACVIRVRDQQTVTQSADSTILQALEAHGLEVHYHCREGFCGACRTTLLQGEVEYTIEPLAYIDDHEILPCCCKAVTDIDIELC